MFEIVVLSMALAADEPKISYQAGDAALEICGVSAPNPIKLIEKILALPNTSFVEQTDQYLTLSQDQQSRFWTLAINKHPASPAIICRTVKLDSDGASRLEIDVSCFASKAACDKLTADFVAHNRKVIEKAGNE
jgi:hypothetical protein